MKSTKFKLKIEEQEKLFEERSILDEIFARIEANRIDEDEEIDVYDEGLFDEEQC